MALSICYVAKSNAQHIPPVNQAPTFKPALFNQFPLKTECRLGELEKLFAAKGKISASVASELSLRGEVIANVQQNPSVNTINIRLSDFPGAMFTLSRIRLEDGTIRYNGHIISRDHSDALVLSIENGKYYFTKEEQRLVVTE